MANPIGLQVVPFRSNPIIPTPAPGVPLQSSGQTSQIEANYFSDTGNRKPPTKLQPPEKVYNSTIKARLLRPSLTSHFQCWFNPPNFIRKKTNYNAELISLSCCEASLPGSSILTNEINDDYTGITERLGYRRQYDNTTDFTFYVDADNLNGGYNVIVFFEEWMRYAMGETISVEDDNYSYRVEYPDSNINKPDTGYRTTVLLNKFERDFKGDYLQYVFIRAYPSSIASMPVSYESSQLLKCTVSFTFNRYVLRRGLYTPEVEPTPSRAIGIPGQNLPVINDINGNAFPLGPGIPGLTGISNPDIG